jgi:hypothetical protein
VEEGLKLWRCIVLILTIIMLLISIIGDDEMSIIVLIICFFALILFQLKNLPPTSYQVLFSAFQLFILLQLAYLIFLAGKLLEVFYYTPEKAFSHGIKSVYYMVTLILFMTVLWRHYQKDQRTALVILVVSQMNVE